MFNALLLISSYIQNNRVAFIKPSINFCHFFILNHRGEKILSICFNSIFAIRTRIYTFILFSFVRMYMNACKKVSKLKDRESRKQWPCASMSEIAKLLPSVGHIVEKVFNYLIDRVTGVREEAQPLPTSCVAKVHASDA